MHDPTSLPASSSRAAADLSGLDLSAAGARRAGWRRRARVAVAAVAAVAVVGVGVVLAQSSGADAVAYRTASAEVRDVDSWFQAVATIEPVSQAAVGFPVDGTVASVDVAVGDTVAVGQTLGTLDGESLEQELRARQAELDQAELTLARALAGEDVGGGSNGGGSSGGVLPASTSTAGTPTVLLAVATAESPTVVPTASVSDEVSAAQQAVLAAQQEVDAALLVAEQALAAATDICAALDVELETSSTTTTTLAPTAGDDLAACRTALDEVLAAQTAVSEAQRRLADASTTLDGLLAEEAATGNVSDGGAGENGDLSGVGPGGSSTAPSPSTNGSGSPVQGATSSSPSAEELVAYQKAVDAAELRVLVATQAVAQATIVSPIAGAVVAVGIEPGDDVTAGSSTQRITVQGEGGYEVTATVGVDDVPELALGQAAALVPDGADAAIEGEVVSIALDGDSTYRVVVGLSGDTSGLRNGATGSLTIVTDSARAALAVPTSAVTPDGGGHTVTVLEDGVTRTVQVSVGVVGDTWTEIVAGLEDGQAVVLADLAEPLPGSATATDAGGSATDVTGGPMQLPVGLSGGGFPGGGPMVRAGG